MGVKKIQPNESPAPESARLPPENHLTVRNGHRSRHTEQCVAYLESLIREDSGTEVAIDTVEYKWAGFTFPYARIAAPNQRLLDAFWLLLSDASILQFNTATSSASLPDHRMPRPRLSRGPHRAELSICLSP